MEILKIIFIVFLLLMLVASILLIKDIMKKQYINKALKLIARIKNNYNESKVKTKITKKAQNIKTKCVLYKQKLQEFPSKFKRFVFNIFENTVVLIAFCVVSLILFLTVGVSFLNKGMVGIFVAFLVLFLTISVLLIRNVSKKQYKNNVSNLIAEIDKINNLEKISSRDNSKLSIVKCKLLEKLKTNIFREALPIGYFVLSLLLGIIFIALAVEIPVAQDDYYSPSFVDCSSESVAVFMMLSGIFILSSFLVKHRKIAKNLFIFSVICMYLPLICFITPFQSAYSYNSNINYVFVSFVLFVLSHFLVFYKVDKNDGYERLTLSEGEYYLAIIKELKNKLYITMEEYYELDDEISKLII